MILNSTTRLDAWKSRQPFDLSPVLGVVGFGFVGLALWYDIPLGIKALALCLAFVLAAISPVAAISAALASTPLIFDPIQLSGREFSLLELAILVGSAGIGVNALASMATSRSLDRLTGLVHPWLMTIGIIVLLVAACVSLMTLADERYWTESLREFRLVIAEPLLFFAACRWVLADKEARRFASIVLVGTGAVVGSYALGQLVLGSDGVVADGVRRATGPYPHPNNLALFLERAGLLGAGYVLASPGFDRWAGAGAAMALLGVGLTFSRGAGLAVLVGLLLILFALKRVRGLRVLTAAAVVLTGVLLVTVGDRVLDTGSTGASSTRWLIWKSSVRMALDHPVWGVGLDQFYTQYWPRYVEPAGWPERYTSHAHNLFLDVWLRLGILGVIAGAVFGGTLAKQGYRIVRGRRSADALALGAFAAIVTGFVHGMVDNGFFLPDLAVLTWFAVAVIERAPKSPFAQVPSEPPT